MHEVYISVRQCSKKHQKSSQCIKRSILHLSMLNGKYNVKKQKSKKSKSILVIKSTFMLEDRLLRLGLK